MNLRTRLALSLLIASLPAKTINFEKASKIQEKLTNIVNKLATLPKGEIDVRDLLMLLLGDEAS